MRSLTGIVLAAVAFGIGPLAFRPAASAWAAQAVTEHDHDHDAGAPAGTTPATPQMPGRPDAAQMSKMRTDMMARMTAGDTQLKTLTAEMNAAKTTDAKVAAMTTLLNALVEQRSMMRTQMDMQGMMMDQMMSMHQMMMQHPQPGASKP